MLQIDPDVISGSFQLNQDAGKSLHFWQQLNIISSFTGLTVGTDMISAVHHGAQAQHKALIETLSGGVERTDAFQQQTSHLTFQFSTISGEQRFLNGRSKRLWYDISQLIKYFLLIDKRDFLVGKCYLAHETIGKSRISMNDFQITGDKQKAVHGRRVGPDLRINDTCIYISQEGFTLQKRLQTFIDICTGFREHFSDDLIAAGGLPIGTGTAVIAEVIDQGPGIENLIFAKTIPVIPFAEFIIMIGCAVVCGHFPHLLRRETEVSAVFLIQDGVDGQIIESTEDAFFRHTENTGHKTEGKMSVVLQSPRKQIAHEKDNLIIKAFAVSLLDWRIIFVDDDDRSRQIVFMKHFRQRQEGTCQFCFRCFPVHDTAEI